LRGFPADFWGKLVRIDSNLEWHPLIDHCADVAAVCEALLRRTLIHKRLATLGKRDRLTESDIQRLAALAALHDVGKFNRGFQSKADPDSRNAAGHVEPILAVISDPNSTECDRLLENLPLREIEAWADDCLGLELLCAAIAHHGRPVEVGGGSGPRRDIWQTGPDGVDPFEGIGRLSRKVREWFPAAFSRDVPCLPAQPGFQHAFCGLVTLADWIGSDRSVFRFSEPGDSERIDFARKCAAYVLRRIGLDVVDLRTRLHDQPLDFERIFGFAPNIAQRHLAQLRTAPGGSLTLLENETGSGKTEAALMRFFRLFEAGLVDGMYFAMPTRTAAVQMHQRIVRAVTKAFPDESTRPPVILAVPGYLSFEPDDPARLLAQPSELWPDDEAARWRFRRWAAEHPKRYLAGAISVGTIDQALLSALAVSHSHLRATSLLRQFLVVDEVHASDAYMTSILLEVLRFHCAAGGHALLLSATLGSLATGQLKKAVSEAQPQRVSLADAVKVPYPASTIIFPAEPVMPLQEPGRVSPSRNIAIKIKPLADDYHAVASLALDAVGLGARALVVRNTVRDCVATQRALEEVAATRGRNMDLFSINGIAAPHHARFARVDRELLDRGLESFFGKNSSTPLVLAATQTVQQSLDIDADLLISDLCPMDVLLQRIGRLQRHQRDRPERFREPNAIVLTPLIRDLTPLIQNDGSALGAHGFGTVYDDLRILEATWCTLEQTPVLQIPAMNRQLVESATHPEALDRLKDRLGERWKEHSRHCQGVTRAEKSVARLNVVDRNQPLCECQFPPSLERRFRTRLGEDDRIIHFGKAVPGPFGHPIEHLTIPGWFVDDAPDNVEASNLIVKPDAFSFCFGRRTFVYDRLGLRLASPSATPEEDIADA
jgi:CRISPR-associated endonuclease/helicase Cas3